MTIDRALVLVAIALLIVIEVMVIFDLGAIHLNVGR
jgi:hypothetical protein